jgi:hypothetical protein
MRDYSRSVVGERGLRPSTWHGFLLQYLSHVLRRENQGRPRMMMRRRGRRCDTRAVQLTSPVALEFYGASSPGGGAGTTPGTESEPWRPPSTHDRGAGQETAPLVGPRGEAVGSLLGQQASSFALPLSAGTLVVPSPSSVSPSRLREGLCRLPLRQSGCARCRPVLALEPRMNRRRRRRRRRRRDAGGRYSATATHQRPLATDLGRFTVKPAAPTACRCTCVRTRLPRGVGGYERALEGPPALTSHRATNQRTAAATPHSNDSRVVSLSLSLSRFLSRSAGSRRRSERVREQSRSYTVVTISHNALVCNARAVHTPREPPLFFRSSGTLSPPR